jgi:hypothetical protein
MASFNSITDYKCGLSFCTSNDEVRFYRDKTFFGEIFYYARCKRHYTFNLKNRECAEFMTAKEYETWKILYQ